MRVFCCRVGKYAKYANQCEMYAKVYEAYAKTYSLLFFSMFGVFLGVLCFMVFLYAKYAKFFQVFVWGGVFDLSFSFRIFAYFSILSNNGLLIC